MNPGDPPFQSLINTAIKWITSGWTLHPALPFSTGIFYKLMLLENGSAWISRLFPFLWLPSHLRDSTRR
jgi:hypothetical protein